MGGRSLDRHGNRLQWSNDKKFDDTLAWMISHRSGDTCDPSVQVRPSPPSFT
jgi:hypothetical protein